MTTHVSAVCRVTSYYNFGSCVRPLIGLLSSDAAKLLVQAFISTRLDYATHYSAGSVTTCTDA